MAAQVDADVVNERLKCIVSTLNSIGIKPVDAKSKGKNIAKAISEGKDSSGDVEALLKSLYELQQEAPKIVAALESAGYVRKNSSSEKGAGDQGGDDEDENDDYDEEDSDDDDWPAVGHGVSDDISIMSDLTTPTVVGGFVDDEEHYHEVQLPMVIGGEPGEGPAMVLKPPKQKSLVHPVRAGQQQNHRAANARPISPQAPNPVPSGGGAAAKRRNQHTQRMAMLGATTELPKKPLPNATKAKTKDKGSRFSFKDIAVERSEWDPDDLSINAFETAIYGEAPSSPHLLDSSQKTGKLQKQSLMDDTDDLFESGFDAFVPFTAGAKPFDDFEEAPTSSQRKTILRKSKSKKYQIRIIISAEACEKAIIILKSSLGFAISARNTCHKGSSKTIFTSHLCDGNDDVHSNSR